MMNHTPSPTKGKSDSQTSVLKVLSTMFMLQCIVQMRISLIIKHQNTSKECKARG